MDEKDLRRVLWADTVGSAASVVLTIAGAALIGRWLDVPTWVPLIVGLVLVPWVALLYMTVGQHPIRRAQVTVIVVGNLGWVLAAAVVIWGFPSALSAAGKWILGVFSLGVLALGVAELVGLRNLQA